MGPTLWSVKGYRTNPKRRFLTFQGHRWSWCCKSWPTVSFWTNLICARTWPTSWCFSAGGQIRSNDPHFPGSRGTWRGSWSWSPRFDSSPPGTRRDANTNKFEIRKTLSTSRWIEILKRCSHTCIFGAAPNYQTVLFNVQFAECPRLNILSPL